MEKDSVTGERCTEGASVTGLSLASSLWWGDHFNPQKSSPDSRILGSIGWNLHFILRNSVFPYHGKINLSRVRKDLYSSFKKNKIMPSGSLNKDEAWVVITQGIVRRNRESKVSTTTRSRSLPLFFELVSVYECLVFVSTQNVYKGCGEKIVQTLLTQVKIKWCVCSREQVWIIVWRLIFLRESTNKLC